MLGLVISLAVQASASATVTNQGVILWQALREGMTADEAAASLRAVDGIKSVAVKSSRKGQTLSIKYFANGIEVAGLPYRIVPAFTGNRLSSVRLESEACAGLATEKYKSLRDLLAQKYGQSQTQREVTEDRELIAIRDTFSLTATRVLLRIEPGSVPQRIYGTSGKVGRMMQSVANSVTDAAIEECPNDRGQKAVIEVTYLNNANAAAMDAQAAAEEAAQRERDKDKL
jgi:hypothetical protein